MGCGQCRPGDGLRPPPRAWTTLRVAHTAHSPDDGVVLFSMIKWPCFQLSRFRRGVPNGPLFDDQMALFSVDKNIYLLTSSWLWLVPLILATWGVCDKCLNFPSPYGD